MFCTITFDLNDLLFLIPIPVIQNYDSDPQTMENNTLLQAVPNSLKHFSSKTQDSEKSSSTESPLPSPLSPEPKNLHIVAKYELVITSGTLAPDNYMQRNYLINGQYPGPEIRIKQNSTLIVRVTNKLITNAITIHFHGIHQRKSFLSDGVPNVTQTPILPGESYTYTVDTWPQAGTFFYHAHTGMDIVSLYGPLIIEDDPETYKTWPDAYQFDAEKTFIINGVYHESLDSLVNRIVGPVHDYPLRIDSITFNGKSYGDWDGNSTNHHKPAGYEVVSVKQGHRYRFRFINAASDSLLFCNISDHTFHVIEMDGIYTEPVETNTLLISPGQRYSLIIDMDQDLGNYQINCKHTDFPGPKNGLAYISYKGGSYPSKKLRQLDMGIEEDIVPLNMWILSKLGPNYALNQTDVYAVPPYFDKEFVVDVNEVENGTRHYYEINGHRFVDPSLPYFEQLKQNINITNPPQVFEFKEGEVIQFIFQNRRANECFSHPWHFHGHTFYVVGEGADLYHPVRDGQIIKENTKVGHTRKLRFRDTITLFSNQTSRLNREYGDPCGWTAIRFVANNPGLWFAHCHVTPHLLMGKKFIMWEHTEEDPFLSQIMSQYSPEFK